MNMQFRVRRMLIADVYVNYVNFAMNRNKEWKQSQSVRECWRTDTYQAQ